MLIVVNLSVNCASCLFFADLIFCHVRRSIANANAWIMVIVVVMMARAMAVEQ